jgi:hypothetical protein
MMTTLAMPQATAVADLVLIRMSLPSKKPVVPSRLREDVGKLLGTDI